MVTRPLSEVLAEYPTLKGLPGDPGLSAYEVAVAAGFVGTEAAWLASLVGQDGLPGNDGAPGAAAISTLPFHGDATANLTLTNQATTEQGLGNSNRNEAYFDATNFTQVRVVTRVVTAGAANARLYPQYSVNGTTFITIGSGTGVDAAALASIGAKASGWITLPAGAKANVIFRIAQNGGDGVADPAVGMTALQFK